MSRWLEHRLEGIIGMRESDGMRPAKGWSPAYGKSCSWLASASNHTYSIHVPLCESVSHGDAGGEQ